jgi:hypothetical protein
MDKMDAIDKIRIWLGIKTFIPSALKRQRNQMESMLREGGWVHLDDEVEGETKPICVMEGGMCSDRQKDNICTIGTHCTYQEERPATIRDLIGRK